jgi:hypothetical protein
MAIKCLRCGFVNEDNVRNCVNCGNDLINNNNTSNVPQDNLELFVQKIYEGKVNLPTRDCPVILKKTEKAIVVLPNITFKEPRAVRTSVGGYGGPTIRIAKGISFKLGGASSRSVSHDEIKAIDKGTLTITNKRLIFTGTMKTLNYNLSKIISINEFKDGIAIQRDNKQKIEYFTGSNETILNYKINGQLNSTPFYGVILKAVIMAQLE